MGDLFTTAGKVEQVEQPVGVAVLSDYAQPEIRGSDYYKLTISLHEGYNLVSLVQTSFIC